MSETTSRPQPDPDFPNPGRYENTRYNTPRRAKTRHIAWTYIALGGWFALAGFIGAFIGTITAQLL